MTATTTEPRDAADTTSIHTWAAPTAGVISAGAAVAVGEFVSDLADGVPSLVISAGEWFIDIVPGSIAEQGIESFGTNDKVALVVGTLIILGCIAALVGRLAWRNRLVGDAAYAVFGLFGAWLAARDPLSDGLPSFVTGLMAAAVGAAVLRFLLSKIPPEAVGVADHVPGGVTESPVDPTADRRAFLGYAGGAAAVAVGTVGVGRALRGSSDAEKARAALIAEAPETPAPASPRGTGPLADIETFDDIEGITTYTTPSTGTDFYKIDTALTIPQVDPADWELEIIGMVDDPFVLTYDEIVGMEQIERMITLSCVSNEVGDELVGNALWTGVPLADILDRAGVQQGAEQVLARSVDNFTAGFPTETVYDGRSALLATRMNGDPLPLRHGFPARLVVAGLYGYVSAVKWLAQIKLTTFDEAGYWIPRGWSQLGPIKIQSRIDLPNHRAEMSPGPTPIAGVAWAPVDGIDRVELEIDGNDWVEATLAEAVSDETWIQWMYKWDADPGQHIIRVRATDKSGSLQPIGPEPVDPDGAEGYHTIGVDVV